MNSYLLIAAKVLRETRQPLSASQILKAAYQLQIVPNGLFGKTQHKTLHARLAEDILQNPARSEFVRTAPGRFYMRELIPHAGPQVRARKEYVAPLRADQLKRFFVLCVRQSEITRFEDREISMVPLEDIVDDPPLYLRLSEIELDADVFYVRIMILLSREERVILHRVSTGFGDYLDGRASIGIMGFIKQGDVTLFSNDRYGIQEAAYRTLFEQLRIPYALLDDLRPHYGSDGIRCVFDARNTKLENAISVVASYTFDAKSSINEFLSTHDGIEWDRQLETINNTDQFDPWSKMILEHPTLRENLLGSPER